MGEASHIADSLPGNVLPGLPANKPQETDGWPPTGSLLLAVLVFSCLSLAVTIATQDFLEMDGCVHYLYARFAFQEHHLLMNVWGRPVCTAVYAVGAAFGGLIGARVMSLLMALATGWITYRIARGQGYRWPVLAMIFLLAQPLVFLHSSAELTELPFAVLLAAGFWAYQQRRWALMAVLVGLMPPARPEGLGFVMLGSAALVLHRQWKWLPVLAAPMLLWSVAGWWTCGQPEPWYTRVALWLPEHWPYSSKSLYQSGSLWHFADYLPAVVGPIVFPAVLAGIWQSIAGEHRPRLAIRGLYNWAAGGLFGTDHRLRCQWLIAIIPVMILVGHSGLFWMGRMASSGELRYMMVVAPLWALLGANGWEWAFVRCRLRNAVAWAGVAAMLPIFANVVYRVVPRKMDEQSKRALAVVKWYESSGLSQRYPRLAAAHPGVYYYADLSMTDMNRSAEWNPQTVLAAPAGTILVWDPLYAMLNADATRKVEINEVFESGWVLVRVLKEETAAVKDTMINRMAQSIQKDEVGRWRIFLSPMDAQGRQTERPTTVPGIDGETTKSN